MTGTGFTQLLARITRVNRDTPEADGNKNRALKGRDLL